MVKYVSKDIICAKMMHCNFRSPDMTVSDFINDELPSADVQPTEKVEEYRSLLEECERKLSYLFECEIESTWESQKVKELIAKIQSCIQSNKE